MYTLLYGALKNMGDFLIYERSKELLQQHKGMEDYIDFHSLRDCLDPHLDQVNQTRAVIICGGPGMQWNMHPGKYKLATNLNDIKVPIVIMGSGWFGVPGDDATLAQYQFNKTTMGLLQRTREQGLMISVRDYLTEQALRNNGITNVQMTGCPSWYDLEYLNREFTIPDPVRVVAFTPPANRVYLDQAVEVMKCLRRVFPKARLVCSFHRGLSADEYTSPEEAAWLSQLARTAGDMGFEIFDASYGIDNVGFYQECDMHVGYRVHGHIYFLGQRKPSFLIHEDGRGRGVSEALGLKGVQGWGRTAPGKLAAKLKGPRLSVLLQKHGMQFRARREAPTELERYVRAELGNGFASFTSLPQTLRQHYGVMKQFLETIP